jgi:DNA gyrase subunit B
MKKVNDYNEESIQVLDGLKHIKLRPTMYIGSLDKAGNTHLVREVVDNSIDEYLNGYGSKVTIEISNAKGYCKVTDEGRGIPPQAIEKAFTQLHSSGKFNKNEYSISSGLNGVGTTCVNALSKKFIVHSFRDGYEWKQEFSGGEKITDLTQCKKSNKHGTIVEFQPDEKITLSKEFDFDILKDECNMKSYINKGLNLTIINLDTKEKFEYYHEKGIIDYINNNKLISDIISFNKIFDFNEYKIGIDLAFAYTNETKPIEIKTFCNSLYMKDGGTPETGFKMAVSKIIKSYITDNNLLNKKDSKLNITGDNIQESIVAIISIKHPNPLFFGQTKDKLTNTEVQGFIQKILNEEFVQWLNDNQKQAKLICNRIILSAKASEAAKKAKDTVIKKSENVFTSISDLSKLANCIKKEDNEIFITEGNSASSTAKECRDKETQAVYSLRGKIKNTNNLSTVDILKNKETADLAYIMTGEKDGLDNKFDIKKLKYDRVIIMADADSDGKHITQLAICYFYRHMKDLVREGHLYVAISPLYSIIENNKKVYFQDQNDFDKYLIERIIKNYKFKYNKNNLTTKEIKNMLSIYDKYNSFITDIENNNSINKYFLDNINRYLIKDDNYKNIDKKALLLFIKSLGDFAVTKESDGIKINGLYDNEFISTSLKTILVNSKKCVDFILKSKLNIGILYVPVKENKFLELKLLDYNNINKKVIPASRSRFKGLGELNSEELWDTTMNPNTRNMYQVIINDEDLTDSIMEDLLNDNSTYADKRKAFLLKNQKDNKILNLF